MTESVFQDCLNQLTAIAASRHGLLSARTIARFALQADPGLTAPELEQLLDSCAARFQIVDDQEEDARHDNAPRVIRDEEDLSVLDGVFAIHLQKPMDPRVRALWLENMSRDPRYQTILDMRLGNDTCAISEKLGLSPHRIHLLEREMLSDYYVCSYTIRHPR